jgi:hypothetical protein
MTTRAEKFLEGFKLGKLGAGRKISHVSPETAQQQSKNVGISEHVKILKEGFINETLNENKYPFIFWQESDDYRYALVMVRNDAADRCNIWFYGGDTLEYVPEGIFGNGIYFFRNYAFLKFTTISYPFESALRWFNELRDLVKSKGVAGFLTKLPTFSKSKTDSRYNSWLKYKRKQLGLKK